MPPFPYPLEDIVRVPVSKGGVTWSEDVRMVRRTYNVRHSRLPAIQQWSVNGRERMEGTGKEKPYSNQQEKQFTVTVTHQNGLGLEWST